MKFDEKHAAILLRVANKTLNEARLAWTKIRGDEKSLEQAYRSAVLASRCARKAAEAWAHDKPTARRLLADAKKIESAAEGLKTRLVAVSLRDQPDAT